MNVTTRRANQQKPVKPHSEKYSAFQNTQISDTSFPVPAHPKGAFAVVTDAGRGMRWTRRVLVTRAFSADGQNRVVLTPSRRCQVGEDKSPATVATERGSPGRSRISRKPSRAGMLGNSGVNVVTNSCVYYLLHARLRVHWAPGIPHALWGGTKCKTRAKSRRGNEKLHPTNTNAQHTRRHPEVRAQRASKDGRQARSLPSFEARRIGSQG